MYFSLIIIFMVLLSWFVGVALKPAVRGLKLLFCLGGITVLIISSSITFTYHYKEISLLALVLLVIIVFVLMMFYVVRRLR